MSAQSTISPPFPTLAGPYAGSSALVMTIFSFSMGDRITVRNIPPGHRSISHGEVVRRAGARRAPAKARDGHFRVSLAIFLLLTLQSGDVGFHAVDATFPKRALLRKPVVSDAGRWLHFAGSYPPSLLAADEATVFQHPQVLSNDDMAIANGLASSLAVAQYRHCKVARPKPVR